MNRILAVLLLLTATVLSGCASSSPELRPYTAEETRELAEEYHAKKAELLGPSQKNVGYDERGEMNAERTVQLPGRPI